MISSSHINAKLVVRSFKQFKKQMIVAGETVRRAAKVAIRVEGNRLRLLMRKEINAAAPGGKAWKALRVISRVRARKPYRGLYKAVRYWAWSPTKNHDAVSIGFNGGKVVGLSGSAHKGNQLSGSWINIAAVAEEGRTFAARESLKKTFINRGAALRRKSKRSRLAKYFFPKLSTNTYTTPARPIINPFWAAHRSEAHKNIISNFNQKIAGQRI